MSPVWIVTDEAGSVVAQYAYTSRGAALEVAVAQSEIGEPVEVVLLPSGKITVGRYAVCPLVVVAGVNEEAF